ncbi:CD74 molecule, major histocompatibility complex, class II invariant chain a [Brachyhypopomus gauderio]|uniref:CD74 molecule, major histocompatibility complex, class II invariant chain a n=1 Tax=Brachyhypopomus gauderio TaxID=698409 RepID=UPI0040424C39
MDEQQNAALLERSSSSDTVTSPRNPNAKAFKVAALTVLACLLLAGQAITAYFVLGQRQHLSALETGQENLKKELTRKVSAAPKVMHVPMNSMPLLKSLTDDDDSAPKETVPLTRVQSSSFQREGSGLIYGSRLAPRKMALPMNSLPLALDLSEDKVEDEKMSQVETRCKVMSEKGVKPGFFTPKCDEQGNYLPMQCWHSTGFCWCVDKDGNEIPDTLQRGRPECGESTYTRPAAQRHTATRNTGIL